MSLHRFIRGLSPKASPLFFGAASSFLALVALASCSDDASDATNVTGSDGGPSDDGSTAGEDGGEPPGPEDGIWEFTTIQEQTLKSSGIDMKVELIRATRPDKRSSYLLYQHAPKPGAPLVIFNEPYAGIDWTGDELDARWATGGNGAKPDTDAPAYNDQDKVAFELQTPQAAVDASLAWAYNGYAIIRPYGRFYAGGTLEDDALDSAAPYFFARTRTQEIDTTRIGSIGASWGGMMAIFGATHSPKDTPPRAVVAISAPSDFVDLWTWSQSTLPAAYPKPEEAAAFYSPYWRRAAPTTGSPPAGDGARPYTHEGICPKKLRGHVLAPHDTWDLLIPVQQTRDLAARCPNVEPLYWPRGELDYQTAKFDHGPAAAEGKLPSMLAFSYAYLVEQIAPENTAKLYSLVSRPSLVLHLNLIIAAQRAGQDVSYILPRLRELADPRLTLFEAENSAQTAGAKIVAAAVNDAWKTAFTEDSILNQLAIGLPPPP